MPMTVSRALMSSSWPLYVDPMMHTTPTVFSSTCSGTCTETTSEDLAWTLGKATIQILEKWWYKTGEENSSHQAGGCRMYAGAREYIRGKCVAPSWGPSPGSLLSQALLASPHQSTYRTSSSRPASRICHKQSRCTIVIFEQ